MHDGLHAVHTSSSQYALRAVPRECRMRKHCDSSSQLVYQAVRTAAGTADCGGISDSGSNLSCRMSMSARLHRYSPTVCLLRPLLVTAVTRCHKGESYCICIHLHTLAHFRAAATDNTSVNCRHCLLLHERD
jgi:hypothetical protein